jgi:uncharacterized protein (TIGR02217 family)
MYNTDVIELNSGNEQRNAIWTYPRHKYDIGVGIKDDFDLDATRDMFYRAKGRLRTFNFLDHNDHLSCIPQGTISDTDQPMYGVTSGLPYGDGSETQFQAGKYYASTDSPVKFTWRKIVKLQSGTFILALDGTPTASTASPGSWSIDITTGILTFDSPLANAVVPTSGFKFYVKVRCDTDYFPATRIEPGFEHVPLTLVEVR